MKKLKNSRGKVWYGLHIVPGVAEYDNGGNSFRVLLNEATIKSLDPSFAGRPVYVHHPNEDVNEDLDMLRNEADGWVSESFFNRADGKHWVKFITVTKRAEKAIAQGYRLSNALQNLTFGVGGLCNGVSYDKELKKGEYEHLAIVPDPRYEQSVILTPEEFKRYNEEKNLEILKLANSKGKKMKLQFFKKQKLENTMDLTGVSILLPKSGKERTIEQLVNAADLAEEARANPPKLKVGETEMSIEELVAAHLALVEEVAALKASLEDDVDELEEELDEDDLYEDDEDDILENESDEEDDDLLENEADDEDEEELAPKKKPKIKNEEPKAAPAKKPAAKAPPVKTPPKKVKNSYTPEQVRAREKAMRLRNANSIVTEDAVEVRTMSDQIALGKSRYGS